jgi:hypothetical protein
MNIKQALKRKNILVDQIKQEYSRLNQYNSVESSNHRPYAPADSLKKYLELTDELVELKTSINKANLPIYDKIFRLSEYKSIVKYLRALDCTEGKTSSNKWGGDTEPKIMSAVIGIVARDTMIADYEEKINTIQDELDYFNQITEI